VNAWPIEPSVGIPVVIAADHVYTRLGRLRRRLPQRFELRHAAMFLAGLVTMLLALASAGRRADPSLAIRPHGAAPDSHGGRPTHAVEGAPVVPLVVGLPRSIRWMVLAVTRAPVGRRLTRWLLHPSVAWIAFALAFWVWHAPALYDLALDSDLWHHVEHACLPRERAALLATRDPRVAGAGDLAGSGRWFRTWASQCSRACRWPRS